MTEQMTAIQAGKRVSSVTRSTEGKTWTIIGTVGELPDNPNCIPWRYTHAFNLR